MSIPLRVFAASIEEIWSPTATPADAAARPSGTNAAGAATWWLVRRRPPAAGVLVAHNNDLDAGVEPHLTAIDWKVDGELRMFTIGVGPWISVGWNSAGLVLSGNELAPNDNRVGVPRLLLVREQLRCASMRRTRWAPPCTPDRASAYNTIFAAPDGEVVNIEGSATDGATTTLGRTGTLVHTNHYVCESMLDYEDDPAYAKRSALRLHRAAELLDAGVRPSRFGDRRTS